MATLPHLVAPCFALQAHADDTDDRVAFAVLYEAQAPRIHRFLRDLLGDVNLANDATQETFTRAFHHHRERLKDRESAVPWLFGIARNVSLELRKARIRSGRVMVAESDAGENVAAKTTRSPESDLLGLEAARVIDAALAQLSDDRKAVLLLRMDHGFAYEDIARLMGFSLAKVKVEIHRARELLRSSLERYERGESARKRGSR